MKQQNFKLIFNPFQADYLIKHGSTVIGAGKHRETSNFYIAFDGDCMKFNQAMSEWKKNRKSN